MKNKKGVSLVILVVTIVITIILAGTIILSLDSSNIIDMARQAVYATNSQEIKEMVQNLWAKEYMKTKGKIHISKLEWKINNELEKYGVNLEDYLIKVTDSGVSIDEFDRSNWEFAYTYTSSTDTWSNKLTKSDGNFTGDIIVKFYKTGKKVDPPEEAISEILGVPVTFIEDDAYRMVIEGSGNMGILMTEDMSVAYAWQLETLQFIAGYSTSCTIPYVTEIIIEDGVTNIGGAAFAGATSLKEATISSSVTEIGMLAFYLCDNITQVYVSSLEGWNNIIAGLAALPEGKVKYDYRTEVERLANEGWQKAYDNGNKTESKLQMAVESYLTENNVSAQELALYNIKATTDDVEVTAKEVTLGSLINSGLDYGKTVNYTANGVNKWKVLYNQTIDGEEYVYLISSESIPNSSIPTNIPGATVADGKIGWEEAPEVQINIENPSLWMANFGDYTKYQNGRVVSCLLSETYWNKFKNLRYGTNVVGAIGTPTIEMLAASYNERSTALGDNGTNSIITLTKDDYGYIVNGSYEEGKVDYPSVTLSRIDKLYGIRESVWIAAPTAGGLYGMLFIYGNNPTINEDGFMNFMYIRPVVCLISSTPAYIGLTQNDTDIILK